MTQAVDIAETVRNPLWFPDRYDPGHDAVHFRWLPRDVHRAATFLTDDYLPKGEAPRVIRRGDALAGLAQAGGAAAPLHFIFHSAFCCSTVLARAFDAPGAAMGLKEPVILNDLIGWQHRGGSAREIAPVLDAAMMLLARPFASGEAVVVKPSNVANGLAPGMLAMRPSARALLLHAPLPVYLGSIAKKGMDGRLWVRDLLVKQLREGLHPFGYKVDDYLGQTDLQVAALGWLAQHALFARIARQLPGRVRTLDSDLLMAEPAAALAALAALYDIALDVPAIVAGPAFTTHSKSGAGFDGAARAAEIDAAAGLHADEIAKVAIWTEKVAEAVGVPMQLPAPLLG